MPIIESEGAMVKMDVTTREDRAGLLAHVAPATTLYTPMRTAPGLQAQAVRGRPIDQTGIGV